MAETTIPHSCPTIGSEEIEAVEKVLRSGRVAQGREVEAFERECADFTGRRHGVAVSSGTAALHLALGALGIAPGQTVAAPSYACDALAIAIHLQGAKAYLCDVGDDYNIDLNTMPRECAAAIVPHLFGATADLPQQVPVIEDLAQSLGGGTGKDTVVAIASFYATKLMTTGEGGMVLCDDAGLAQWVRDHRDYDNRAAYEQRFNYKMTDFQAAMGRVQLKRLPGFIARRREIAMAYQAALRGLPLEVPAGDGHVFFRYAIATEQRQALESHLQSRGIEAKRPVHSPTHLHFTGPHRAENVELIGAYPGALSAHEQVLSLPLFPSMVDEQVQHVIECTTSFF